MRGPTPRRLLDFVTRRLRLQRYLRDPGDGRPQPQIPAKALLWSLLIGQVLRACSFLAVERLVRSSARRALAVSRSFSDDALDYFTERLDPTVTRVALVRVLHQAKRNKAFETSGGIGLAVDGSTVGWRQSSGCSLCRPYRNADQEIAGYRHHMVLVTVVGTGLSLPFDVEPYGPGDSEYAAGQRLLRRAVELLGVRFAAYVVVDGEFATAPFLHTAGKLGLPVVARLKANLPELLAAAQKRFRSQAPKLTFSYGDDRVELWDAEDFDPWESLQWETVRVLRYRQQKPDGKIIEALWLTDSSIREVSSRVLFHRAKSRWEIENQGFNDAKNRHDLEHICHHHPNSLLITWLLTSMALTIERLYRLRYLRRGTHPPRCAADSLICFGSACHNRQPPIPADFRILCAHLTCCTYSCNLAPLPRRSVHGILSLENRRMQLTTPEDGPGPPIWLPPRSCYPNLRDSCGCDGEVAEGRQVA